MFSNAPPATGACRYSRWSPTKRAWLATDVDVRKGALIYLHASNSRASRVHSDHRLCTARASPSVHGRHGRPEAARSTRSLLHTVDDLLRDLSHRGPERDRTATHRRNKTRFHGRKAATITTECG